jgi:hypothetical protein
MTTVQLLNEGMLDDLDTLKFCSPSMSTSLSNRRGEYRRAGGCHAELNAMAAR